MSDGLVSAASALIGDPALFGRVAEDGTVYVRTVDGEKPVGSYPGKSNEEALAYFVRKFEQLASEIALTAARVRSGAMVPSDADQTVVRLREQVATINAVGDLAALAVAVEQIPHLSMNNALPTLQRKRRPHKSALNNGPPLVMPKRNSLPKQKRWPQKIIGNSLAIA